MKKISVLVLLYILSGCAMAGGTDPMIKANPDSDYEKTYQDLGIGQLHDFEFTLPEADERWVRVWLEGYQNGEKLPEPLVELSYGKSPIELEKGHLGTGMIRGGGEGEMLHLYAPGVSLGPRESSLPLNESGISTWDYAIGEEEITLKIDEEVLLGVYRQPSSGSIQSFDLQNKTEVERMIKRDGKVLLLKMKIEKFEEHGKAGS